MVRMAEGARPARGPVPAEAATSSRWPAVVALTLAGWAGLVAVAHLWGRQLLHAGARLQLGPGEGAPPLVGEVDLRLGVRALPALVLAVAAVGVGPRLAARLGWRHLLLAAGAAAAAWAVALALIEPGGLTRPLLLRGEYLGNVGDAAHPLAFLRTFTDRLSGYHTHVQGHPPGMVLLLAALDRLGFGGASWAAAVVIVAGASAVPAVLLTVRAVVGEVTARAAAPFLAFAPAALWMATTADGLYMGVIAWGIALLALAGDQATGIGRTRPDHRAADLLAAGAGLLLGAGLFLSYGLVLCLPLAGAVALAQRRPGARGYPSRWWRRLLIAASAALAVVAVFAAAGFWWPDGLLATRRLYQAGVASRRPYGYFLVANLAAFALVVGPAAAAALARLAHRGGFRRPGLRQPVALLAGAALLGVVAADVSGLSKGEVERIWLPFAPWVLVAAGGLVTAMSGDTPGPPGRARAWLGLQALVALALGVGVRTPW